ncbi:MAG: ABC transporter permease [bacterium]
MRRNKLAVFGLIVLGFFILVAIFAPLVAPFDPSEMVDLDTLAPSLEHPFGTDDLGRDIFSRAIFGARISLTVGVVAVTISVLIGTLLGALAGYFGRWTDGIIMRFVDIMLAFPSIFLILTIQAMLTPNIYNVTSVPTLN